MISLRTQSSHFTEIDWLTEMLFFCTSIWLAVIMFLLLMKESGIDPWMVVPHGSYLLNCGSSDDEVLRKTRETLVDELKRCEKLGLPIYNFHPGLPMLLISVIIAVFVAAYCCAFCFTVCDTVFSYHHRRCY